MSAEWAGILDPGEEILWQGPPDPTFRLEYRSASDPIFALVFVGFSVFWMVQASAAGGVFWMFGLIFFAIGLHRLIGKYILKAYERRHTFYTLTNQRAFIARRSWTGKKTLDSYPLTADTTLKFEEGRFSSIYFSEQYHHTENGSFKTQTGFERIENGREVYRKMRDVQRLLTKSEDAASLDEG